MKGEELYRAIVNSANDGIIIIREGLIRLVNRKAAEVLGIGSSDPATRHFSDFVTPSQRERVCGHFEKMLNGEPVNPVLVTDLINRQGYGIPVEMNASILDCGGRPAVLVLIRELSGNIRTEQSLRLANQKLNLLSDVTRHDILNKLTVVIGYLELAKLTTRDREKQEDFIRKIDAQLKIMQEQVEFTRDYQDMGVRDPQWQDAGTVLDREVSRLDCGRVRINNMAYGLNVFADPLFGKVLYNIVDNALRYGGKLTRITVSFRQEDGDAVLVIEDDGVGILPKDKPRIFDRGFGHNTGFGLFLAREILSLTGISIMETGFPLKGARFELHIPPGRFRITEM